jgi:hypothetical protein
VSAPRCCNGQAFNDFRRSTALQQLLLINSLGLLTEEDLARFTPETRQFVEEWSNFSDH